MSDFTTIPVGYDTRDKLRLSKRPGESYEEFLLRELELDDE